MKFEKVLRGGTIYNGDATFRADVAHRGEGASPPSA